MKNIFRAKFLLSASLLAVVLVLTSCKVNAQKQNRYVVSGTIKGLNTGWVKLTKAGGPDGKLVVLDSTQLVSGAFKFIGSVETPDMVDLSIEKKSGRFMLENSVINIDIDLSTLKAQDWRFTPKVSGSKTQEIFEKVDAEAMAVLKNPKYKELESLNEAYSKAKKSNDPKLLEEATALQKSLEPLFEERSAAYKKVLYDYARNNPSSAVAVHVLGYQYSEGRMSKEQLKEFYELFKGDAKQTTFYKNYITKVYKDVFENLGVGNKAPGFTLNMSNGKQVSLADVKGKYRLVDFWASWCVPCRESFPHLKELRKKYGTDKFEIVGVGTADVQDKWVKAIEEDQIQWIQVFDDSGENNKGRAPYGPVAKLYGVPFLPTTFLIDENQTILLRNASKEELDAKLKELLGY